MAEFQLRRQDTERATFNAVVFVGTYLANVVAWLLLALHPWRWLGMASGFVAGFMILVQVTFQAVNGTGFGHHEANLVFSESQFLGPAMSFFGPNLAGPAALALALWASFMFLGRRFAFRSGGIFLLVFSILAFGAAGVVIDRSFGKVFETPTPTRIPVLVDWVHRHRVPYYDVRSTPTVAPSGEPWAQHIVLVVDESVSGHWLGINGASPDTTPWLSSLPEHVINLGVASAISNLSSSSNLLLQTGLQPSDLPDSDLEALRGPNLFSYFKQAGFFTSLIDAQSYSDQPPNLMTRFDLAALDHHSQVRALEPELAEHEMDGAALGQIEELIHQHTRTFTYLIKNGVHIPYADKIPPSRAEWPRRGGDQQVLAKLGTVRAQYLRALEWNVDAFLHRMSDAFQKTDKEIAVVYTADHGQDIERYEETGLAPHATVLEPSSREAAIPILFLGFGERTLPLLKSRLREFPTGAATAFSIFPSLLEMAGYSRADATRADEPSLFEGTEAGPNRVFVSGNVFARDGGFYVLNPSYGDAMHIHEFDPPEPHRPRE